MEAAILKLFCVIIFAFLNVGCFGISSISTRISEFEVPSDSPVITPPPATTPPAPVIPKIAQKIVTGHSSCILHDQGLDCWGQNNYGQLGTVASATPLLTPVEIVNGFEVDDIALSASHSCAIIDEGLKCIGLGLSGQLGNGQSLTSSFYVDAFPANSQITSIAVGSDLTCAIKNGGLYCFGSGANYRLGNSSLANSNSPIEVFPEGSSVSKVSISASVVCAVVAGEVWCWGQSGAGLLGMGATVTAMVPTKLNSLGTGNSDIQLGTYHACAVKNGGVYCWGYNWYGMLGDGSSTHRNTPVLAIPQGSDVTSVSVGDSHSCALVDDEVFCWGSNSYGQLLNSVTLDSVLAPSLSLNSSFQVVQIVTGPNHTCALNFSGNVFCWGGGALGNGVGGHSTQWTSPTQVLGLTSNVTKIAKFTLLNDDSNYQSCAIQNGGAKCWGTNLNGVLGNGSTVPSSAPVLTIPEGSGVTDLSVINGTNNASSCAVVNGGVQCWGMGYGVAPLQIIPAASSVTSIEISQFGSFSEDWGCVIMNGGVQCWGANSYGQLGNGNTTSSGLIPVIAIANGAGVTQLELFKGTTCAIVSAGLRCWGNNNAGQLGDGSIISKSAPAQIFPANSGVTDVAIAGDWNSPSNATVCAVVNGGLRCWGYNGTYLVGNGATANVSTPIEIFPASSGVTKIISGEGHFCAVKNFGLYCWGSNYSGSLGVGDSLNRTTPTIVIPETSGVTDYHGTTYSGGCAIVAGGLKCWGQNSSGEVGDGTVTTRLSPVEIFPAGAGVQAIQFSFDSVACAIVNNAMKCWGGDYGYGLVGAGQFSRGSFYVNGFD